MIYLDYHATTPVAPRVWEAMRPWLEGCYGNAASNHALGREAKKALEDARARVAQFIGASPKEIYFTSGATESNNTVIKGLDSRAAIITSPLEHKCVLYAAKWRHKQGMPLEFLQVDDCGRIDWSSLHRAATKLKSHPLVLVSIMGANNEVGTYYPSENIAEHLPNLDSFLIHVDAAQSAGKRPIDVRRQKIDALSLSAHKISGPKGIGVLYLAEEKRDLIAPLLHGGGQERGMRAGTLPVALAVGMGEACDLARSHLSRVESLAKLRDSLQKQLSEMTAIRINGPQSSDEKLPGNLNVCFQKIDPGMFPLLFKDICVSQGSACTGAGMSHVLAALGYDEEHASRSVRFGLGFETTSEEISRVVEMLKSRIQKFVTF